MSNLARCAVPGCGCFEAGVGKLCRRHFEALPQDMRRALWKAHRAFRDAAPQNEDHRRHVYATVANRAALALAPEVQPA